MVKRRLLRVTHLNLNIVYDLFINKRGITIKKISGDIRTDYKNTYNAVDFLFKEGIIKKERVGNYNICRLNYDNEEVIEYLKWHNFAIKVDGFKKRNNVEYQIIMDTINELKKEVPAFFICLVFGSYSKNEEREGSDIDTLFLSYKPIKSKAVLNRINAPYQRNFHVLEQDIRDFIKDLKNKDKLSIASEISKEPPIVFYGADIFFRMILAEIK